MKKKLPQKYISVGYGYSFANNKLSTGQSTDHLINYNGESGNLRFPDLSYFFDDHWGVYFKFNINFPSGKEDEAKKFDQIINNAYSPYFYVTADNIIEDIDYHYYNGNLGAIYRIETDYMLIMPFIGIDILSIDSRYTYYTLKEKDGNRTSGLQFRTDDDFKDIYTIALGTTIAVKITKNVSLFTSFEYTPRDIDLEYEKNVTDFMTGNRITTYYKYSQLMHCFNINTGLMIGF